MARIISKCLPPPVVGIRLQLSRNCCWDPVLQPHIPQQCVIPFLVQEQLSIPPQPGVDLAVLVEVGGVGPAAVLVVQVEDGALADVDEETDFVAASV